LNNQSALEILRASLSLTDPIPGTRLVYTLLRDPEMFNNNPPEYMPRLKGFNNKENSNLPPTELVMSDSVEPLIGSPSQGARDKLSEVVRSSLVINNNYYKYNYWGIIDLIC